MHVMLVSISRLTTAGCQAVFDSGLCQIFNADHHLLGQVHMANGLYKTQCDYSMTAATVRGDEKLTMKELHCCLSHIGVGTICEMLAKGMMIDVTLDPDHSSMGQCAACKYGKATCMPIGKARDPQRTENLGDKIHINVWGSSPIQAPGKWSYYCSFTDNHTCYTQISLIHTKLETFDTYLGFKSWLKT